MLADRLTRKIPFLHLSIILVLCIIAYSNTFTVPFTFDDGPEIVQNERIRDVSNIPSMFVHIEGTWGSRPMLHATDALNYHFGGFDTRGYHAVNLALHLLNGVLLYLLVASTGGLMGYEQEGSRLVAAASSLIFVLHPMQTEGVTYISSRSALFAMCFFLSGMLLFSRAVFSEKKRWVYVGCLFVVSMAGMASRENFATFPVLLILYDLFFVSKFSLKEVVSHRRIHLAAVLSLGYMAYLVLANTYAPGGNYPGDEGIAPLRYAITEFSVQWTYLRMLLLPVGQTIDHDYRIAKTLFELPTLIAAIGYVGLLAGSVMHARKRPAVAFGVLWFLITLAPVSFLAALFDLRLQDVMLEHRAYIPNAGAIVAFVTAAAVLIRKVSGGKARAVALVCMALMGMVLVPVTYARNSVWKSTESQWADVIKKSPRKWRGYYNLANEYQDAGRVTESIDLYKKAISLNPRYPASHNNLGLSYKFLGFTDKAIEEYREALVLDPNYYEAYNNSGNIYFGRRLYGKAIEQYKLALESNPESADVHYNIGIAYYYLDDMDNAIEHYSAAIAIGPDDPKYHYNLGMAYLKQSKDDLARREFISTLSMDPGFQQARVRLEELSRPANVE